MVSKKLKLNQFAEAYIQNPDQLSSKIKKYECRILFKHNNIEGNAKSILGVLAMCTNCGDDIWVICDGKDEKVALKEIVEVLEHGKK